jgi:lysophospholipase L1-like esterase
MCDWERYFWLTSLGPILWLQGKYVRRVTPRLPEPPGPRDGMTGQGPLLRLLVAGDSAAAGVGASSQAEALSGQLVSRLSRHHTVEWRLIAANGLDSPGLVRMLEAAPVARFDVVVLSIGVNDVTGLRSPRQWLQWQDQLASVINRRFEPSLLVHSAVPPMHAFTALPQPLRWFFGRWAREFNRLFESLLSGQTQRTLHSPFLGAATTELAADGFHPGPRGYAMWAEGLSQFIRSTQQEHRVTFDVQADAIEVPEAQAPCKNADTA